MPGKPHQQKDYFWKRCIMTDVLQLKKGGGTCEGNGV